MSTPPKKKRLENGWILSDQKRLGGQFGVYEEVSSILYNIFQMHRTVSDFWSIEIYIYIYYSNLNKYFTPIHSNSPP